MTDPTLFKIFLSSPGDVPQERDDAQAVIKDINDSGEFDYNFILRLYRWDNPKVVLPMPVSNIPQKSVDIYLTRPSACDLTVVIFCSKMGSRLVMDGQDYESGTHYEYSEALAGGKSVWLYRCAEVPVVHPRDPKRDEKLQQFDRVEQFFKQFQDAEGRYTGGVNEYATHDEFKALFKSQLLTHLRYLRDRPEAPNPPPKPVLSPAPPAPEPSPYTAELVVDARGGARYTTINAALKAAPAGARITVRPGLYQEGIVLDKPITIEGQGGPDQVIVENDQGSVLVMATDEAMVSGLGMRCTAGTRGKKMYGVDIPQGRLILRECAITSDSLTCVGIHNAGTRPYLFNCRIYSGKHGGVYVYDQGAGVLEDCQMIGNALSGLEIRTGGNPTVRRCTLKENKQGGVFVNDQGAGVLEDCQIIGNALSGLEIRTGGNPTVRRCTMKENKESGVFVNEQGAGVLEDCQIIGNAMAGLEIREGGNPMVRRCTITQNGYSAVRAYKGGRGTVEDCDLRGNQRGAWNISADSAVTRRNNQE